MLTRMSVEVFDQATRAAGSRPEAIPTIWATAHGEHDTAIKLLRMMGRGEGKLSPTHFHNSVHNTPSGYASIAAGNTSPSTTLTGGPELVASSFLEAFCHLEARAGEIAVVFADEPLQAPFSRPDMRAPLALAFCLSSEPEGAMARLSHLRSDAHQPVEPRERFGRLYVSAGLPLLEHAVFRKSGTIALELEGPLNGPVWCVDLEQLPAG
jgi:hypothetical protein